MPRREPSVVGLPELARIALLLLAGRQFSAHEHEGVAGPVPAAAPQRAGPPPGRVRRTSRASSPVWTRPTRSRLIQAPAPSAAPALRPSREMAQLARPPRPRLVPFRLRGPPPGLHFQQHWIAPPQARVGGVENLLENMPRQWLPRAGGRGWLIRVPQPGLGDFGRPQLAVAGDVPVDVEKLR